jgi:hypothetical protein
MTYASVTTLNLIRAASPCEYGWRKLLSGLGKTRADDEPLPLLSVLDINGLDDALWVLSYAMPDDRLERHFQAWCAEQVLHLFEAEHPGDLRVREQIAMLRNDTATPEQRTAAWAAARAASGAARASAQDAAQDAAWAAARAASGAARAAAWAAARAASGAAARDEQEKQLRAMIAAQREEGTW